MTKKDLTKNKGYFITFEGIEGSGKTTTVRRVFCHYDGKDIKVTSSQQPKGSGFGCSIKGAMDKGPNISPSTKALAYAAARSAHFDRSLGWFLSQNYIVFGDRYIDSSLVYQSSDNLTMDKIIEINKVALGEFFPNLTFVLLIDPKDAQERLKNSGREMDGNDKKPLSFHKEIDRKYRTLGKLFPERIVYIDAGIDRTCEDIANDVIKEIEKRIEIIKKDGKRK